MERGLQIFAVVMLLAGASAMAAAGDAEGTGLTQEKYQAAVANLLIGLKSDNQGLRESSACMLGELKADEAVVPLMAILRSDAPESSRIVAALALCRIGDSRGVYAVKRAVQFDASQSVQQKCAWFYEQYVKAGSFEFAHSPVAGGEEMAVR
jgi:HEAT repeat protein